MSRESEILAQRLTDLTLAFDSTIAEVKRARNVGGIEIEEATALLDAFGPTVEALNKQILKTL